MLSAPYTPTARTACKLCALVVVASAFASVLLLGRAAHRTSAGLPEEAYTFGPHDAALSESSPSSAAAASSSRPAKPKNFLIFFSGHQGSSMLADALRMMPEVYVPGFEPLEVENMTGDDKLAYMDHVFSLPAPPTPGAATLSAFLGDPWHREDAAFRAIPGNPMRLYHDAAPTASVRASGFKFRPFDGRRTGLRGVDRARLRALLHAHDVSIVLSTRLNTLKTAVSWYRARELGLNQFHARGPTNASLRMLTTLQQPRGEEAAEGEAPDAIVLPSGAASIPSIPLLPSSDGSSRAAWFNLTTFDRWLHFVESTDRALVAAVTYFNRPTLTVAYERLAADPVTAIGEVAAFVGVPARPGREGVAGKSLGEMPVRPSARFVKSGSDRLRDMIANFDEFCAAYWHTPYQDMLGVESCDLANGTKGGARREQGEREGKARGEDAAAGGGPAVASLEARVPWPDGSQAGDCFASGWHGGSECDRMLHAHKVAAIARARAREAPIFFKHMHKAGGTTLCSAAGANVFIERRSLPHAEGWNTDCVPQEAFMARPPQSLLSSPIFKGGQVDAEALIHPGGSWLGGACFFGHLSVGAQHALPSAFPLLGFIASEGPLPDELALNLPYPLVTMLREPTDRALSAYKWWRFMKVRFPQAKAAMCQAYDDDAIAGGGANATFEGWLLAYPDNWMTRALLGSHFLYNHASLPLRLEHLRRAQMRLQVRTRHPPRHPQLSLSLIYYIPLIPHH